MPSDRQGAEVFDVAVVGGGPAGLTTAIALATAGIETALVAPRARPDNRTSALFDGSVKALEALGVWDRCQVHATPLTGIRIVDDRGGLLHAPELLFRAEEIGLTAFGYNIPNTHLVEALSTRSLELSRLRSSEATARAVVSGEVRVTIGTERALTVSAKLVVGADGRDSLCRRAADIAVTQWSYPQVAITCNLKHRRAHECVSTEFHTSDGPFTLVPLADHYSSLVWVTTSVRARELLALDESEFAFAAERQAHSLLGKFESASSRSAFPLSGQTAKSLAAQRIALVGEAAHVLPPIGAQGLNLGLRDAATLAEIVSEAKRDGADPGALQTLERYSRARRIDVESRVFAIDALNRSLLSDFIPLQGARTLGLMAIDRIAPLRQALMRRGAGPQNAKLLRGEVL